MNWNNTIVFCEHLNSFIYFAMPKNSKSDLIGLIITLRYSFNDEYQSREL